MRQFLVLFLSLSIFILSADVLARGVSRSSSRSFSRPSTSKPATVAPKRAVAPRKATSTVQKTATKAPANKATVAKPKAKAMSKTDKALAKKNNAAAKKYGSKANAEKSFKENMKSDPNFSKNYPNKFDSQPVSRPDYIPGNVSRSGVSYNVTYMNGGYGYMGPMGTWMMIDMMTDIAVTNAMLNRHGYGSYGDNGAPVVIRTGPGGAVIAMTIFAGIVVLVIILSVCGVFS